MARQFSFRPPALLKILLLIGIGFLLGIAVIGVPPIYLLAGIAGVVYIVLIVKWSEIAILAILLLTSTIIDIYSLPKISIGVGHIIAFDLVVIIPIVYILVKSLIDRGFKLHSSPLNLPLFGFYGIALLSTAIAIIQGRISFNQCLGELRDANTYLAFFMVTNLIWNEKQLRRLLSGIFFLAIMVAVAIGIQYVVGDAIQIMPGRIETVETAGVTTIGITRILPPGQSLIMVGLITTIILLILEKETSAAPVRILQICILGAGVLLTFNRNFWVGIGLALLLISFIVPLPNKVKFLKFLLLAVFLALIVLPIASTIDARVGNLINASVTRLSTLFNAKTLREDSLQYRFIEMSYAIPQIEAHPLIGLGLGALYRPWDSRIDSIIDYEKRAYIHNGHLWVMIKTGIAGYICLIWLISAGIWRGFKNWKSMPTPLFRGVMVSFSLTLTALLVIALVNPVFGDTYWAPVIGVMIGIIEKLISFYGLPAIDSSTGKAVSLPGI